MNYVCEDASEDVEDEAEDEDGHGEDLITQNKILYRQCSKKLYPFKRTQK